jgi:hypothetical protein
MQSNGVNLLKREWGKRHVIQRNQIAILLSPTLASESLISLTRQAVCLSVCVSSTVFLLLILAVLRTSMMHQVCSTTLPPYLIRHLPQHLTGKAVTLLQHLHDSHCLEKLVVRNKSCRRPFLSVPPLAIMAMPV